MYLAIQGNLNNDQSQDYEVTENGMNKDHRCVQSGAMCARSRSKTTVERMCGGGDSVVGRTVVVGVSKT